MYSARHTCIIVVSFLKATRDHFFTTLKYNEIDIARHRFQYSFFTGNMPGESLTCVYQAVHSQDRPGRNELPKDKLKIFLASASGIESVSYSERVFDETFPGVITYGDFKRYVRNSLREKGVSDSKVCNDLEELSWDTLKSSLKSGLEESVLYKLWRISNRLVKEDTYPPVIFKDEVCWLTDKLLSALGHNMKTSDDAFKNDKYTFQEMLVVLDEFAFADAGKQQTKSCIDDLYTWLVTEIMKQGKVYKRTKKQANWTNWVKRWCVLTPDCISYFVCDAKSTTRDAPRKGEFPITKSTKLESLEDYNSVFKHLQGRFRLSNVPVLEMEMSISDENEKRAWLSDIEDIIRCLKEHTTPVQKLLKERHEKSMASKENDKNKQVEEIESALKQTKLNTERQSMKKPNDSKAEVAQVKFKKIDPKEEKRSSLEKQSKEKLKAMFMKIDKDGNGVLDKKEFQAFLKELGLNMSEKESNLVFNTVDSNKNGKVTYKQFEHYFSSYIMNESATAECVNAMRRAFLQADRDGSGTLNFREFTEFVWEKNRAARMSKILKSFENITVDEISFNDFKKLVVTGSGGEVLGPILEEELEQVDDSTLDDFEGTLQKVFDDTEAEELTKYIRQRWNKFATFRRAGHSGTIVMKGGHGMVADIVPGEYSLIDLACFSDLPPLVPKHTIIQGAQWLASSIPGKSGKIMIPPDFDHKIVTDLATSELLRYYECSFADAQQEKISLLFRHGIQDFTYENGYLEKYVTTANGGAGIEKHDFSHLDCPLAEDSGIFILGKFVENGDLHITGFRIPVRHTLYVPGGTIHSNDYLKGTWRTMLSDETNIDHVHLTQRLSEGHEEKFRFEFV